MIGTDTKIHLSNDDFKNKLNMMLYDKISCQIFKIGSNVCDGSE